MNFETIFYLGPEMNVCGYYGDYRLIPGKVTVESWIANILFDHGYCLSIKQKEGAESYERRNAKQNKKGRAGHKEIVEKEGRLRCQ